MDQSTSPLSDLLKPPRYCHYAAGQCDQDFRQWTGGEVFFLYPSAPAQIAATIEGAVSKKRAPAAAPPWRTWRDLPIAGQIIFCEVCKGMRYSKTVVADVTTLNFNVMYEIGFALGLGLPVIPIRDTSYIEDTRLFEEIGVLDTLGYLDFANSQALANDLMDRLPVDPLPPPPSREFRESPLYLVKTPQNTEGAVQLNATIKKSGLKFRAYDPIETPRVSLNELRRQVAGSYGVICHLLSPQRQGAQAHNGLCALAGGLATAQQKVSVLLQEDDVRQPIDYRDIVLSYRTPDDIKRLLAGPVSGVVERMQSVSTVTLPAQEGLLAKVDMGDVAAENEIRGLESYFVQTGQYRQAEKGHARLVVGRKGSGKTAIFYRLRDRVAGSRSRLVLDLKPEGHQFTRLRDVVLSRMTSGLQEHTMVAFWTYILLAELAREILREYQYAKNDPDRLSAYEAVERLYEPHNPGYDADFAQRLHREAERVAVALEHQDLAEVGPQLTEIVFKGDVRDFRSAVSTYLSEKDSVWLLLDNLDKGWPARASSSDDMLILRSLMEASRKLQRDLERQDVSFNALVFLRTDIYEHFVRETADKGKDTAIRLDWDDPEMFREIVRRRIAASTGLEHDFQTLWPMVFASHIEAEDTFNYLLSRTLMRPRDLLQFMNRCIEVAINRLSEKVGVPDIEQAERSYSEDLLLVTSYEIYDTRPQYGDVLYAFHGQPSHLERDEAEHILLTAGVDEEDTDNVIEILLWFGFFGASFHSTGEEMFAYSVQYNIRRLQYPIQTGSAALVIHPAFRAALETQASAA